MAIPNKYLHQSGRHKGNLKQDLLQCEGEFVNRDPHPIVKGVFYKGYCNTKKKQNWGTIDHFPELDPPAPPKGIPEKLLKNGKLNQKLLQIEGNFQMGDKHPVYKRIVFHGIRGDSGTQRWQTKDQYERNLDYGSKYQADWRKENLEEARRRVRENHKKLWANEDWASNERKKRREKRANRTPKEKEIERVRNKKYREENPEKTKARRKKDYLRNKDRYIAKAKEWVDNNKDKRRDIVNAYHERHKDEPEYKILQALRTRLYNAVSLKKNIRSETTKVLLGCSVENLKKHLETQFTKGMTWENFGNDGWHIDHIIPCAFFDLTKPSHQKICFNYQNLQPLWAKDNLSKRDKIPLSTVYTILKHGYKSITLD
jgi:hypothetical protein